MADRFMVEDSAEGIFESAVNSDVALLVVGDPLCATTHTDMMIRARKVLQAYISFSPPLLR